MMILNAVNVTPRGLLEKDGLSDYDVWVGINERCVWRGKIEGHVRAEGAAKLLRLIAEAMDCHPRSEPKRRKR